MTHTEENQQRTEHRRGSAALRRQAEALQASERPHLDAAQRQFIEAMRARGLTLPGGRLIADGRVHRCDVAGNGKAGRGDGSYVLFSMAVVPPAASVTGPTGAASRTGVTTPAAS